MKKILADSQHITVSGHFGAWYIIDCMNIMGKTYFLLEHEEYGNDALAVIVDENGMLIMEDVSDGFNELQDFLIDKYSTELYPIPPSINASMRYAHMHYAHMCGVHIADKKLVLDKKTGAYVYLFSTKF